MTCPKVWHISATGNSAAKACPTRYRLGYVEGLRLAEDTDSQRQGTNWHKLQEIITTPPGAWCPLCGMREFEKPQNPDCPVCGGTGQISDEYTPLELATEWLNSVYSKTPDNRTVEGWSIERATLAYAIAGYLWFYDGAPLETVARELSYNLPVRNPQTGRVLPNVRRVGKIDRLIKLGDHFVVGEYKSTSKSLDHDSSYWHNLNMSGQAMHYITAARELQFAGELVKYGIKPDAPLVSGCIYDVWHKPGITPKMLTQGDSKAFVESGEYCGQKFKIDRQPCVGATGNDPRCDGIRVDDICPEIEPGKKPGTFALRETPDMYGARLLADITERPQFYFARREFGYTDADLTRFEQELVNIYHSLRMMDKNETWWRNEQQCEATFRCPYTPICYHNLPVFDGKTTPDGFRRIFTDQAIEGE